MSEKTEKYGEICGALHDLSTFLQMPQNDEAAEIEATLLIRELSQFIERLRRVVGESDTDEPPHSLTDVNRLHKDELAFIAWQFFQWGHGEDCPVNVCHDFPCQYRRKRKDECEESLQNGDLDEAGMEDQREHGYYAHAYCDEDGMGCWAEYYLWCYRNGVNPLNGKKEDK